MFLNIYFNLTYLSTRLSPRFVEYPHYSWDDSNECTSPTPVSIVSHPAHHFESVNRTRNVEELVHRYRCSVDRMWLESTSTGYSSLVSVTILKERPLSTILVSPPEFCRLKTNPLLVSRGGVPYRVVPPNVVSEGMRLTLTSTLTVLF